jgi:hypothetical protein
MSMAKAASGWQSYQGALAGDYNTGRPDPGP